MNIALWIIAVYFWISFVLILYSHTANLLTEKRKFYIGRCPLWMLIVIAMAFVLVVTPLFTFGRPLFEKRITRFLIEREVKRTILKH